MYYIAKNKNPFTVWHRAKNLRDFKAENDLEYAVARNRKVIDEGGYISIYVGVNGKLKKTNSFILFHNPWFGT